MILEELEDEICWDEAFKRSKDALAFLAGEAMAEYRAGKTQALDPEAFIICLWIWRMIVQSPCPFIKQRFLFI